MRRALATTVIQKILALSRRRHILDSASAAIVKPSPSPTTNSLESLGFRLFRSICRTAVVAVSAGCVANTFFTVVGYPACVVGGSMRPALNESPQSRQSSSADSSVLSWLQLKVNWVFVNCWKARGYEFQRGEIVVFVSPKGLCFDFPFCPLPQEQNIQSCLLLLLQILTIS